MGRGLAAPPQEFLPNRGQGVWGSAVSSQCGVRGTDPESFEFGAFGGLKITSKQCKMTVFVINVVKKLYGRV